MSDLPLNADIRQREWHVRYVPIADVTFVRSVVAYPMFSRNVEDGTKNRFPVLATLKSSNLS
jgi:hypothetical protein